MAGYKLRELETVYEWIVQYLIDNALPPTLREIGQAFNMSAGRADRMLMVMERWGWLYRHEGKRRLQVLRVPARNRKLQSLEQIFQEVAS